MGTSVERHSAQTDLSKKAEGYGVPGERIDGMDVLAVREGVAEHIRIAREERRPTLVEAFTYRFRGHSAADPEVYREKEEVEEWRAKDPIETFAKRCVEARACSARRTSRRSASEAEKTVLEAVEFADASPEPPLDTLYENLYVVSRDDGLVRGRRAQPGAAPRRARGRGAASAAKELAEAGAAHAGAPAAPRPDPARARATPSEGTEREGRVERRRARRGDATADGARCGCARRCATRWRRRCGATSPSS